MIYLDNSATTRPFDEVVQATAECMGKHFGNPSSLHSLGVETEKMVRKSRKTVADSIGASPEEVYFTSGGTEGDNSVLFGCARGLRRRGNRIITTKVEHPAVLEACKRLEDDGFQIIYLDVDQMCRPNMEQLEASINDETILVSVMGVNNEVGTIMPIDEIARATGRILFHTDAVQSYGKVRFDLKDVDFMTVSGHKINGPKGIGAMYIKKGVNLPPFICGGGQEKHQRSGTENVPGIVGFGEACRLTQTNFDRHVQAMAEAKNYLSAGIKDRIKDIRVNSPEDGAASILNISFLGTRGEVILHTLEQDGIYVSTGSACSSNKKGRSHVLTAMGLSEKEIEGAIRFSFGYDNTVEEMDVVLDRLEKAVSRFRSLGTFR